MARKKAYSQGRFIPKNPEKYIGSKDPIYRSSWELVFMNVCDNHPSITKWASESVRIPYFNTFTQKHTIYIPDFLIQYVDKNGKNHVELIEIKPLNQTLKEKARGTRNKVQLAINTAKWNAARKWAKNKGMMFRILTEAELFAQVGGYQKRKRK